jgi:lysozyme
MKVRSKHFKYSSILFLICSRLVMADVDNIPHSSIVCGTGSQPLAGVDVSVYQSKANWSQVSNSGTGFAFIKATEGLTSKNTAFPVEWPAAGSAGLLRSAYHYFVPTDDPIKQADFFLNTVGTLGDTDLPPMFDWEITNGLGSKTVVARAQQWLDYVEQNTGRTPIIYTNAAFFNQLGNPTGFDRYPLYVSDYQVNCPKVPQPWTNWTFWQHSSTGNAVGIPGHTDLDWFNGSFDDLVNFISSALPADGESPTGDN